MTRVLVIKTSSLGDVIHTLPAINDAVSAIPGVVFDWVVEENFSEIPAWNYKVDRVISVSIRKWRKNIFGFCFTREWSEFKSKMNLHHYDAIIDAQGLLKSAWLTRYANGETYGFDKHSARESLASSFYDHPINVSKELHAVERIRLLFSRALGYSIKSDMGEHGLSFSAERVRSVVLLHGTTWASKHWPEKSWIKLSSKLVEANYRVSLTWGNEKERFRAERIARETGAEVLPKMTLTEIALLLSTSTGCISVDTGLGHLAAAVNTPTLAIFGPTNSGLTGFYGSNQKNLTSEFKCAPCMSRKCVYSLSLNQSSPCFEEITPDIVFKEFTALIDKTSDAVKISNLGQREETYE